MDFGAVLGVSHLVEHSFRTFVTAFSVFQFLVTRKNYTLELLLVGILRQQGLLGGSWYLGFLQLNSQRLLNLNILFVDLHFIRLSMNVVKLNQRFTITFERRNEPVLRFSKICNSLRSYFYKNLFEFQKASCKLV